MGLDKIKKVIKNNCKSKNPIISTSFHAVYKLAFLANRTKNILTKKEARETWLLKTFHSKNVHQTTPTTAINRYPQIFTACQEYFQNRKHIKILSFGCSTGEEVITLRQYFPDAVIVGAEINKYCLEVCQNKKTDDNIHFIKSTDENISENGPYDAIFCMAVFQRTPQLIHEKGITDLSRVYPFSKFEQQLFKLNQCLKEKGLMIVHYSQYYFKDTEVSTQYKVYRDCNQDFYCCTSPIFDKRGKLIPQKCHWNSIFIKDSNSKEHN